VQIALTIDPSRFKAEALTNWQIVQAMKLPFAHAEATAVKSFDDGLIIDAIFGTGLSEPPRDPFAEIVKAIADSENPVLAIDVPSGLDCDTGEPLGPAVVVADRTITFVAPKTGFRNPNAAKYLGEVSVGDIGCPRELIDRVIAGTDARG
jgi:NAD(P)H-hydrate epimerase